MYYVERPKLFLLPLFPLFRLRKNEEEGGGARGDGLFENIEGPELLLLPLFPLLRLWKDKEEGGGQEGISFPPIFTEDA